MNIRHAICLLLTVAAAASCTDSAGLGQLDGNHSKLIIYAFPTDGDSIGITVSLTCPMNRQMPPLHIASISCRTNGQPDRIVCRGDTIADGMPIARYTAVGRHRSGDTIAITVTADGMPTADGSTVIPQRPIVDSTRIDTAVYKGNAYPVVRLSMRGNGSTQHYAVGLEGLYARPSYDASGYYQGHGQTGFVSLEIGAEPLLRSSTNIDITLGDWDDNAFNDIYRFGSSSFADGKATLHLYADTYTQSDFCAYRPHLFALSTEYDSMLRSLNDINNNDLGKYGLAFAYSTYTNIRGGYGCIGAYTVAVGDWLK